MMTTAIEFRRLFPLYTPDVRREVISLVIKIMDRDTPDSERSRLAKIYDEKMVVLKDHCKDVKFDISIKEGRLVIV
jgi:hypothetical protein